MSDHRPMNFKNQSKQHFTYKFRLHILFSAFYASTLLKWEKKKTWSSVWSWLTLKQRGYPFPLESETVEFIRLYSSGVNGLIIINNLFIYSALFNMLGDQKRITTINNLKTINTNF